MRRGPGNLLSGCPVCRDLGVSGVFMWWSRDSYGAGLVGFGVVDLRCEGESRYCAGGDSVGLSLCSEALIRRPLGACLGGDGKVTRSGDCIVKEGCVIYICAKGICAGLRDGWCGGGI